MSSIEFLFFSGQNANKVVSIFGTKFEAINRLSVLSRSDHPVNKINFKKFPYLKELVLESTGLRRLSPACNYLVSIGLNCRLLEKLIVCRCLVDIDDAEKNIGDVILFPNLVNWSGGILTGISQTICLNSFFEKHVLKVLTLDFLDVCCSHCDF